jgi:F0F1-type ATP synthase assembly protein I
MEKFYQEHPVITMVVGAAFTIICDYVGATIMGKGLGYFVVNEANKVCDENEVQRID